MINWKDVIAQLVNDNEVIARWQLNSGTTFFMYLPTMNRMGDETITKESDVRFDEILNLYIMNNIKLGKISKSNNIEKCKEILTALPGINISQSEDGIKINLMQ